MWLCFMTHIWYSYLRSHLFRLRRASVQRSTLPMWSRRYFWPIWGSSIEVLHDELNSKRDDKGIDAARGAEGRFTAFLYLYTMVGGLPNPKSMLINWNGRCMVEIEKPKIETTNPNSYLQKVLAPNWSMALVIWSTRAATNYRSVVEHWQPTILLRQRQKILWEPPVT